MWASKDLRVCVAPPGHKGHLAPKGPSANKGREEMWAKRAHEDNGVKRD
jgi:hypothetical protein